MDDTNVESCKVVLLGESGVGKTSIIAQFMDAEFIEDQQATTGATFSTKSISYPEHHKEVSFEIWDTAGQEKYRSLTKMFYKDASIAILVYDVTRLDSYTNIRDFWVEQLKENAPKKIILAIAANKCDLIGEEKVNEEEARQLAAEIGAMFRLTSAKQQIGVEELFRDLGNKFIDPNFDGNKDARKRKTIKVKKQEMEEKEVQKKGKCC